MAAAPTPRLLLPMVPHPLAGVVRVACLIGRDPGYVSTDVEEALQQGVGLVMHLQVDAWGGQG
jgi:hypothetical protein